MLFDHLITKRERLLLRFNDKHVIDSNSELMDSLPSSESDLLCDYRNKGAGNPVQLTQNHLLRETLKETIMMERRKKKCAMLKHLDYELLLSVGKYRHTNQSAGGPSTLSQHI